MAEFDNYHLASLRAALLDHPIYTHVASVADLRRLMEDHVFAVWDLMSLLKPLQQDMTCFKIQRFRADNARGARLINDIVISEETDIGPDGSYVSHLCLRALRDVGANTRQFEKFRSLVLVGAPVDVALGLTNAPRMCKALLHIRWRWPMQVPPKRSWQRSFTGANTSYRRCSAGSSTQSMARGTTAIACAISSITSIATSNSMATAMARRDVSCSKAWSQNSPQAHERAVRAACGSIEARIGLWDAIATKTELV
jgi:hypothetical protein